MQVMCWALTLGVVGGAAELVGIGLAFAEIRDRARKLNEYRTKLHSVGKSVAALWDVHETAPEPNSSPRTTEQRLDALEARIAQIPEEIATARKEALNAAVREAHRYADEQANDVRGEVRRTTDLLLGSLSGHRRAYASVGFIVGGLLMQTLAGILGNLP